MSGGKGEHSVEPHAPQDHRAVDVPFQGEYQSVEDPEDKRNDPNVDLALVMFRSLTVVTSISAVLCAIVNLVSLIRSFRWRVDTFVAILRIYTVVFAGFIAVAETEWEWLFHHWPYLQYWFFRGMLQIFVAVLTMSLAGASWEVAIERVIHEVSAWVLLGCGVIYALSGLFCFSKVKRRRVQKKQWREQAVKDLEELDKKKRDIQALLASGA